MRGKEEAGNKEDDSWLLALLLVCVTECVFSKKGVNFCDKVLMQLFGLKAKRASSIRSCFLSAG